MVLNQDDKMHNGKFCIYEYSVTEMVISNVLCKQLTEQQQLIENKSICMKCMNGYRVGKQAPIVMNALKQKGGLHIFTHLQKNNDHELPNDNNIKCCI